MEYRYCFLHYFNWIKFESEILHFSLFNLWPLQLTLDNKIMIVNQTMKSLIAFWFLTSNFAPNNTAYLFEKVKYWTLNHFVQKIEQAFCFCNNCNIEVLNKQLDIGNVKHLQEGEVKLFQFCHFISFYWLIYLKTNYTSEKCIKSPKIHLLDET